MIKHLNHTGTDTNNKLKDGRIVKGPIKNDFTAQMSNFRPTGLNTTGLKMEDFFIRFE